MRIKTLVVGLLMAGVVASVGACDPEVSNQPGTSSPGTTVAAPGGNQGGSGPGTDTETAAPQPSTTVSPAGNPAPNGSGHGMCFDLNSRLANEAVARLAVPGTGPWRIESASEDPISAGCAGTLSWMTVMSGNIHPWTHILYFSDGAWLGTATAKPYGYTTVLDKTKNSVKVRYLWLTGNEALCCPEGGPSVVTFTLKDGRVQTMGQFPPDK